MMKVTFLIPSMAGGGAERVISELANEFVKEKIDTTILMTAEDECVYTLDSRVRLVSVGGISGGSMRKRLKRLADMRRYFRKNRDNILIAFEPDAAFFAAVAKTGLSMKMISSERNDPGSFGKQKTRKFAYRHSDRIVFQTGDAKAYFPVNVQKKGLVIPNPVSVPDIPVYNGERENTVVCVGRLEEQKNHRMLLKAFQIFSQQYPEYTLHMYGKGTLEKELKLLSKKLDIDSKVIWEGFCSNIAERIQRAGMYVLSSDYEGISNSLLEAMAIGLPVIATDCPCGGCRLCIENEKNGLLVPVGDDKAMAEAMGRIAAEPEKADSMGKTASKIAERFSIRHISGEWIALIKAFCVEE